MPGIKKVVPATLALIVLEMSFLDYWSYSHAYHENPAAFMDVIQHTAPAPAQYRIGVLEPAGFIMRHSHLGLRHILSTVDLITGLIAVFTLFFLLRRTATYRNSSLTSQWFGAAVFALLVQFYLPWVTWYQRPETMTTVALVALSLLLLTVRIPLGTASMVATIAAQLLLATAQGFVRADVTMALYAGVFLACLTRMGDGMALPRRVEMIVSVLAMLLAGGIQYYLSHVVYPLANYEDSPVFQLVLQFKEPARLIAFIVFIPPYVWLIRTLIHNRIRVQGPSAAIVLASAIYMAMWWMVGRVEEVRIFMPFAIAVVPLTVATAMELWLGERSAKFATS